MLSSHSARPICRPAIPRLSNESVFRLPWSRSKIERSGDENVAGPARAEIVL